MRRSTSDTVAEIVSLVYRAQMQEQAADIALDNQLREMCLNGTIFKCSGESLRDLAIIINRAFEVRGQEYDFLDHLCIITHRLGGQYARKFVRVLYPPMSFNASIQDLETGATCLETEATSCDSDDVPFSV